MKKKMILWKILLIISLIPFIIALGYGIYSAITGFSALCILNCVEQYGISAFVDSVILYSYVFWPTYIVGMLVSVISTVNMNKLKNKNKG